MPRMVIILALLLSLVASAAFAQPTPPAPGVEIPRSLRENFADSEGRFQFGRAWIEKARIARENRERLIADRGFYKRDMVRAAERNEYAVTGTINIPVFCVKYSDSPPGNPFTTTQLQSKLFSGPYSPQTLAQYYSEISSGNVTVTGSVFGWYTLSHPNSYYVPPVGCDYGMCGITDGIAATMINTYDPSVDFGQYDNDGPDNIPNSGDDDGFVDVLVIVHPESGGECGQPSNIWSHHRQFLYQTNDARAGGGFIRMLDCAVLPIYNCDNTTMIDIGVFCHEIAHAFGLPDLFDTDGGSRGVGNWCLMGYGWSNSTSRPAHMGAWAKDQLGWADVIAAPGELLDASIPAVETSGTVYRIDSAAQKWRWIGCFNGDQETLHCGLQATEANNRNWAAGAGYGNGWDTTVSRDFHYNGSGPVSLLLSSTFQLQGNSDDFAYVYLTVGNTTTTLATYSGANGDVLEVNLAPYMTGPGPYKLSIRVKTGAAGSDEDGGYATTCGAMSVDYMYVIGGGENYQTNFADRADGWAQDPPFTEYFLVENRQALGSDVNLPGTGLVVWHIDQIGGNNFINSGGPNNNRPRAVEVEQADGLGHLEANLNNGDAGDPFPGSSNKLLFTQGTNPASFSHSGGWPVFMQLLSGNGNPIHAKLFGGFSGPSPDVVTPAAGVSGQVVQLQVDGLGFYKTPTAKLVPYFPEEEMRAGATLVYEFPSTSVQWLGNDRIIATFNLTGAPNGLYDIIVFNPGGASGTSSAVFSVSGGTTDTGDTPRKFELSPNYPNPFNPSTSISFQVPRRVNVDLRVYDVTGALVRTLLNETKAAGTYVVQWDGRNDQSNAVSSGVYFYRINAGSFSDVRKMTLLK